MHLVMPSKAFLRSGPSDCGRRLARGGGERRAGRPLPWTPARATRGSGWRDGGLQLPLQVPWWARAAPRLRSPLVGESQGCCPRFV